MNGTRDHNGGVDAGTLVARLHVSLPEVAEPRLVTVSHFPPTVTVSDDETGLEMVYERRGDTMLDGRRVMAIDYVFVSLR